MFYAITPTKIYTGKTLEQLNKNIEGIIEIPEMKAIGNDHIVNLDGDDLNFIQDKKRLADIPIRKLFRTKEKNQLMLVLILLVNLIVMLQGCAGK